MIRKVSDCVGCQKPCVGKACRYYEVTELICDECKEYVDDLYLVDGEQLCAECALKTLEKVEVE